MSVWLESPVIGSIAGAITTKYDCYTSTNSKSKYLSTQDGSVVSWGHPAFGGDNETLQERLKCL